METKVVELKVNTNFDDVNKDIKQLDKSLGKLEESSNNVSGSMKDSSLSVLENGGAMGLLNDATGGLAMTVKDAVEATALFAKQSKISTTIQAAYATVVGTSTGAMKVFRLALVGTGIGAIVVGLGLLISNFDKVKKAVLNLVPGLSVIGDIFTGLVETVTDFVGVTSEASRDLDKLGKQANATLSKNKIALDAYGDTYDQYTKRKIEANNKYAQHVNDVNEDETLSEAEKLKKLKILRETANREIAKSDSDRQSEKNKKAKDEQDKINDDNKVAREKRKEQSKIDIAEQKKIDDEKLKEKLNIEMQSAKDAIAILDELKKSVETPAQKEQREFNEKKVVLEANNLSTIELETQHKNNLNNLELEYRTKEADAGIKATADAKANAETEKQIAEKLADSKIANLQRGSQMLGQISDLIGQNTAAGKVAAVASATIDTYAAAQSAFANAQKNPISIIGPAYPYISAGLAIAGGLKNVRSILSVKTPGGGGGGSVPSGGGATAAPNFNVVGTSGQNQIAQTLNREQPPIKAYVVANDVTTQQGLNRNIVKSASI
jgi:hypothetical protein